MKIQISVIDLCLLLEIINENMLITITKIMKSKLKIVESGLNKN
jgi:hypothetical protein